MADDAEGNVWDSWEDMVDSGGLDERLEKEEQTLQEIRKKEEARDGQPIVLEEDTHRTKYQPTLTLMKRQNDDSEQEPDVHDVNKVLTKSLAERKEEYAQARLRILGSAKNEEDEDDIDRSAKPARTSKASSNDSKAQPSNANKASNNNSKASNNVGKGKKNKNRTKKGSAAKR